MDSMPEASEAILRDKGEERVISGQGWTATTKRKDIPALGGVTRNSNRLFETGAQVSSARQKISQETPEKNKRELLGHGLVRYC